MEKKEETPNKKKEISKKTKGRKAKF